MLFFDDPGAMLTDVDGGLGVVDRFLEVAGARFRVPMDPPDSLAVGVLDPPLQHLKLGTMRAGYEIVALVGCKELGQNARGIGVDGTADFEDRAIPEVPRALLTEADGVPLLAHRLRIAVDLVEEQVSDRLPGELRGGVRARDDQVATEECQMSRACCSNTRWQCRGVSTRGLPSFPGDQGRCPGFSTHADHGALVWATHPHVNS